MNLTDIKKDLDQTETLKLITEAYSEIALVKLKRIRQSTETARIFFSEISQVYGLVRSKSKIVTKQDKATIRVVLTSNDHFYGHIDNQLIKFFLGQNTQADKNLVIGRSGRQLLESAGINNFISLIIKKDLPSWQELQQIVTEINRYDQVFIYYPQFRTILNQIPNIFDLTQSQTKILNSGKANNELFIFEPEIDQIRAFFETQIKLALLEQVFLEAELARTSSRLISMDQSQQNADKLLVQQKKTLLRIRRDLENIHLLETLQAKRAF